MLRKRSVDLINQETEWGIDVSEATGQTGIGGKALMVIGYFLVVVGVMVAMPIVIGYLLFPITSGVWREVLIVAGIILGAVLLKKYATSGPRNALQIDYEAGEVRLGSTNKYGVFARHRVCPFSQIEDVSVDQADSGISTLTLVMNGETATVMLSNAEDDTLRDVVSKIKAAKESAKAAPVRSRIQSAVMGFEAGFREVGQRVRSRVVSRTA